MKCCITIRSFVCLLFFVPILFSCKKDVTPVQLCVEEVSFAETIQPFIELNCSTSGCHDASASGGYEFLDFPSVSTNASIILNVIKHEGGFSPMPMNGPKTADSTILQFQCWIEQGKLNN